MDLIYASVLFAMIFLLHLIVCRAKKTWRKSKHLVRTFLVVVSAWAILGLLGVAPWAREPIEFSRALLILMAIFFVYLSTFTAIELESVSCLFAQRLKEAGSEGLEPQDMLRLLNDNDVILSRLRELQNFGFVTEDDGRFTATKKGLLFLWLIQKSRAIFGRGEIGG